MKKDNEESKIIDKCIKEGQIVPVRVLCECVFESFIEFYYSEIASQ
mgnify:CR=1 FL=1